MGKVSRRLTIVVFPPLSEWSEIEKLEEQGHQIIRTHGIGETPIQITLDKIPDLVIGPNCWYFDVKHRKYLTLAIKQARLKRYGKPQKKEDKNEKSSINLTDSIDNEPFRGEGE